MAQLRRIEPLTADKVQVFVEAGQLTGAQAELVKRYIDRNGQLQLPANVIAPERRAAPPPPPSSGPRAAPPTPAREPATVRETTSKRDANPYAAFGYALSANDREQLRGLIKRYRRGNRPEIGAQLRKFRPEVNELIVGVYPDKLDMRLQMALWAEVAGPANPDAAIGLAELHRDAYDFARPILIAYDKDAGGIMQRRIYPDPEARLQQYFYTSRELRDLILDIEGQIARCAGPNAAIYLINVYSQRYSDGPIPMRDKGRDRHRMVQACGGDPERFDQDEPKTWHSTLTQRQRAIIAERLIPWLHRSEGDRRQIARNGLMICIGHMAHPDWDDGPTAWENWWEANKARLLQ